MADLATSLPVAVQVALGGGYMAYLVAYAGLRQHHTAADATFRAFVFGLPATAMLAVQPFSLAVNYAAGLGLALFAGVLWRMAGMPLLGRLMRASNVSWANDLPSAWLSITAQRTDLHPSQIAVDIDGGRVLFCDDTREVAGFPHGPCVFGLDGSIAMYVTAECKADGTWIDKTDVNHPTEGAKITYIPAAAVKRVELRYWSKANGLGAAAAAGPAKDAAVAQEA